MHKLLPILKECMLPFKRLAVWGVVGIGFIADFYGSFGIDADNVLSAVKPFMPWVRNILFIGIVIYGYVSIAKAKCESMEKMTAKHKAEILELDEEHDQEMIEIGARLLARATEARAVSYDKEKKELTAEPLHNVLLGQLVSIKVDERWASPTRQVLVGIGVIDAVDDQFTIIRIVSKYGHTEEWKYITDKNEKKHQEQLSHTIISTAIPYSVLRRK